MSAIEEAVLLQLLQADPMLVIFRIAEIPLAGEQVDDLARAVDVLGQRMAEVPLAPIAILDAAAERRDALGLQLVAGGEEIIPGLGRRLRRRAPP